MNDMSSIGNTLKELREFRKYSQEELAEFLKVKGFKISRETLSKMENGSRNISFLEMNALAEILNVSVEYFSEEEEEVDLVSLFRKRTDLDQEDELFLGDIYLTVEIMVAQERLRSKKVEDLKK